MSNCKQNIKIFQLKNFDKHKSTLLFCTVMALSLYNRNNNNTTTAAQPTTTQQQQLHGIYSDFDDDGPSSSTTQTTITQQQQLMDMLDHMASMDPTDGSMRWILMRRT